MYLVSTCKALGKAEQTLGETKALQLSRVGTSADKVRTCMNTIEHQECVPICSNLSTVLLTFLMTLHLSSPFFSDQIWKVMEIYPVRCWLLCHVLLCFAPLCWKGQLWDAIRRQLRGDTDQISGAGGRFTGQDAGYIWIWFSYIQPTKIKHDQTSR